MTTRHLLIPLFCLALVAVADEKPTGPAIRFTEHLIADKYGYAFGVAAADLDGDGDQEWKKEMIDPQLDEARTIRVADFNGDGKPDLLSTGRIANLTAWYERIGVPSQPWQRHVIDDKSLQPVHGEPIDMDGDGDADVVMGQGMHATEGQAETNQVVWYENVGQPGNGGTWKKHIVGPLPFAFEAVAADLDGDRDIDIVATAWGGVGQLVWFANTGDPRAEWKPHLLKDKWPRANQPIVADLDGDKRPDIIATAEVGANEIRWWRNGGVAETKGSKIP